MSDTIRFSLVVLSLASLLPGSAVSQQLSTRDRVAFPQYSALRQRADSLIEEHQTLNTVYKLRIREDSIARELALKNASRSVETFHVGPLSIVADSGLGEIARSAGEAAYTALRQFYGSTLGSVDWDREPLELRIAIFGEGRKTQRRMRAGWNAQDNYARASLYVGSPFRKQQIKEIADHWQHSVDVAMSRNRPPGLIEVGVLGSDALFDEMLSGVYAHLKLNKNPLGPSCLEMNMHACRRAFGLDSLNDRERLIGWSIRATLLHHALRMGGDQAYARFIGDSTRSLEQRLSDASGASTDSLLRSWHKAVVRAKPAPAGTPLTTAIVAIAWASLLGVVSLRSSRWR